MNSNKLLPFGNEDDDDEKVPESTGMSAIDRLIEQEYNHMMVHDPLQYTVSDLLPER